MRKIYFKSLVVVIFILFLNGCKDNNSFQTARSFELSARVDSILKDTVRMDQKTDSLRKQFYTTSSDTQAIDILNKLYEKYPSFASALQKEAYTHSIKLNYNYGKIYSEINGANYAQSIRKVDSADAMLKDILLRTKAAGYKYLEAKTLNAFGYNGQLINDLNAAEGNYTTSLDISKKNNFHDLSANNLIKLGQIGLSRFDFEKAFNYASKALEEAKISGDGKLIAISYGIIAESFRYRSNLEKAAENYLNAVSYAGKSSAHKIEITCLGYAADCYSDLGNYVKAIELNQMGLAIAEKYDIVHSIESQLIKIGGLHLTLKEYDKAIELFKKGLALAQTQKLNDNLDFITCYKNLATVYCAKADFKNTEAYVKLGVSLSKEIDDRISLAFFSSIEGNIFFEYKDYKNAVEKYLQCLDFIKSINVPTQISSYNNAVAHTYQAMGEDVKAKPYALAAYEQAILTKSRDLICGAAESMSRMYEMENNYKKSLEMFKIYKQFNDSSISNATFKQFSAKEFEGKERSLKEVQKNKDQLYKTERENKDLEIKQQKTVQSALIAGAVILFLLVGIVYRSLQQKKKANQIILQQKTEVEHQKHLVEEKQTEILDSIHYAKRIQKALLPNEKYIERSIKKLKDE